MSGPDTVVHVVDDDAGACAGMARMLRAAGQLHRMLQERQIHVPVVYVTAHDDPQAREDARRQGCAGFFGKADSGRLVVDAIRQGTARHRAARPAPDS